MQTYLCFNCNQRSFYSDPQWLAPAISRHARREDSLRLSENRCARRRMPSLNICASVGSHGLRRFIRRSLAEPKNVYIFSRRPANKIHPRAPDLSPASRRRRGLKATALFSHYTLTVEEDRPFFYIHCACE